MSEAASGPAGTWVVSGIRRGAELEPPVERTSLSLEFDDSGRVFGSAGCDRTMELRDASGSALIALARDEPARPTRVRGPLGPPH